MARKCKEARLLGMVLDDVRFRLAGNAAVVVWLRVVRLMEQIGSPGRLHLGSASGSASGSEFGYVLGFHDIPLGLGVSETEWKTEYETLIMHGLLVRDGDVISAPLVVDAPSSKRAEAARINGLKGGRPRKNAPKPDQREMLMPVSGGAVAAAKTETEPETHLARTCARADRSDRSDIRSDRSDPHTGDDWVKFAQEMAEVAGLNPVHGGWDLRPVQGWLDAGISRETIREEIAWRATLSGYQPPRSFMAFNNRIRERHAARPVQAPPENITPERAAERRVWLERSADWKRNGCYGEPPAPPAWMKVAA